MKETGQPQNNTETTRAIRGNAPYFSSQFRFRTCRLRPNAACFLQEFKPDSGSSLLQLSHAGLERPDLLVLRIDALPVRELELRRSKIQHDLLASASNRDRANFPVNTLHLFAETSAVIAISAEDLHRLSGTELAELRCLDLQQGDMSPPM